MKTDGAEPPRRLQESLYFSAIDTFSPSEQINTQNVWRELKDPDAVYNLFYVLYGTVIFHMIWYKYKVLYIPRCPTLNQGSRKFSGSPCNNSN
jgi:hypothetical protein